LTGIVAATQAPDVLKWGAFAFGALVGWNAYFINRYRKDVLIGDLAAIIGAVGGGAVLTLFPAQGVTFGYYGLGLALGFFGYLAVVVVLIAISPNATVDWLLFGGGRIMKKDGDDEGAGDTAEAEPRPAPDLTNIDIAALGKLMALQRPLAYMLALHRLKGPDPPL
jgi:hypothetical protein